jgi:hypothetical protein
MDLSDEPLIDVFALICVIVLLPFYIGFIDSPFEILLAYAVAGGFALAIGERLVTAYLRLGLRNLIIDAAVYGLVVLVYGMVPFGLAIWLI